MVIGSDGSPLRVAIVGSGPAAFFAAEALLRARVTGVEVDMFERLPFPFGLVRYGVAPDHQKIKAVTARFTATASLPGFRFFGGVDFGTDVTLADLEAHYHQVLFATGAQSDRRLGIPGEDLPGSHAATDFVGWYNGHPDRHDDRFDLSCGRAVVVGAGNVALDVARILSLSRRELWASDAPRHVVKALCASKVREVVVLGRRGPAQAAFSVPEVKELGSLPNVSVRARADEVELDPRSADDLDAAGDAVARRRVSTLQSFAAEATRATERRIALRFLASPVEILPDERGRVGAVRVMRNRLERSESGALAAAATGEVETISTGLVVRSVGYRGVPLPGVPFDERAAVIPTARGRVLDAPGGEPLAGLYAAGWIRRGPSGVIGTNKPDAVETVKAMMEDAIAGRTWVPERPAASEALAAIRSLCPEAVAFDEWRAFDEMERRIGAAAGRPREKFVSAGEARAAVEHGGREAA